MDIQRRTPRPWRGSRLPLLWWRREGNEAQRLADGLRLSCLSTLQGSKPLQWHFARDRWRSWPTASLWWCQGFQCSPAVQDTSRSIVRPSWWACLLPVEVNSDGWSAATVVSMVDYGSVSYGDKYMNIISGERRLIAPRSPSTSQAGRHELFWYPDHSERDLYFYWMYLICVFGTSSLSICTLF